MTRVRGLGGALAATRASRLRREAALVLLLALTTGLLAAWPQAALRAGLGTVDAAAVSAVADAGRSADLLLQAPVGADSPDRDPALAPADLLRRAPGWVRDLPAAVRARAGRSSTVLAAPPHDAQRADAGEDLVVRLAVAADVPAPGGEGAGVVDVVVARGAAAAAGLVAGDTLRLAPDPSASSQRPLVLRVAAVVRPDAAGQRRIEEDLPDADRARPLIASDGTTALAVTAFTSAAGALRASRALDESWTGTVRVRFDPDRFDAAAVTATGRAADRVPPPSDGIGATTVRSGFAGALAGFAEQAAAAVALQRVAVAGALVAGLLAMVLLATALAAARADDLRVERVRGLTAPSCAVRALVETAAVGVPAALAGTLLAGAAVPGAVQPLPLAAVLAAVLVAAPVAEARALVGAAAGGPRRAVAQAGVVVLAALALVSLRDRSAGPADPLLLVAPALAAIAAAVVLGRAGALGARLLRPALLRGRGPTAALLGAGSGAGAALVAIAVAAGVAAAGAGVVGDLDAGRVAASWRRVGADVAVAGTTDAAAATRTAAEPGVAAAAAAQVDDAAALRAAGATVPVVLTAVDRRWTGLLAATPAAPGDADRAVLARLDDDGRLPVAVAPRLADDVRGDVVLVLGGREVPARVVGTVSAWPTDDLADDGLLVDAGRLAAASRTAVRPDLLLVAGPGAAAATAEAPGTRTTRAAVLAAARAEALPAGVGAAFASAAAAAAALALLALGAALRGTRHVRGDEAGLLAVLGLPRSTRRRLLALRTGPALLLAALGGAAAGTATVRLLAAPLGLDLLSAVPAGAGPVLPVLAVAVLGALVATAVAVLLEPVGAAAGRTTTGETR